MRFSSMEILCFLENLGFTGSFASGRRRRRPRGPCDREDVPHGSAPPLGLADMWARRAL